jgi:hypothetical protein
MPRIFDLVVGKHAFHDSRMYTQRTIWIQRNRARAPWNRSLRVLNLVMFPSALTSQISQLRPVTYRACVT